MKRYEFTGETKTEFGITLHRIRATATFTIACCVTVQRGEEGGWIEKESNLDGNAWVFGNAWVYGDARVYGNAWVYGDARVYGNAQVYGNALVCGDAEVFGNAQVYGNALVCGDAEVFGNARVFGNAWLFGNARVFGNAWLFGNARVFGNAFVCGNAEVINNKQHIEIGPIGSRNDITTFFLTKDKKIAVKCGCFIGDIDAFRKKVKETHGDDEHAKAYLVACDLAEMRIHT